MTSIEIDFNIFIGFLSLFSVLGILLNAATLVAIIARRSLRKTQNIFTFNVALGDFVSSCAVVIQRWLFHWAGISVPFLPRGLGGMLGTAWMVGICSTLAVAIHRFIIIRLDPFQNRRIVTATRCVITCVIMWAVALTFYLVIYLRLFGDSTYLLIVFPIMTLCAVTITTICYTVVYITISTSSRGISLTSDAYLLRVKRNKKVLYTFFLVVFSNLVGWVFMCFCYLCWWSKPSLIFAYNPQYDLYLPAVWFKNLCSVAWWMVSANTVINPIIYWTRLSDFRRLISVCCGQSDLKDSSPMTKGSKIKSECGHSENEIDMEVAQGIDHKENESD